MSSASQTRWRKIHVYVQACAICFALLLDAITAAPVLATPSKPNARVDPSIILEKVRAATGGAAWSRIHALRTHASIKSGGRDGAVDTLEDVTTGRFVREFQLSPGDRAKGFDGISTWIRRPGGAVAYVQGDVDSCLGAIDQSFRAARGWWFPERRAASSEYAGARREGTRTFDLIRITPEAGRPFVLWIDRATHLIDRDTEQQAEGESIIRYGDYRWVNGVKLPFNIVREDEYFAAEKEIIETIEVNPAFTDTSFGLPPIEATVGQTSDTVPFQLKDNTIVVGVKINGQGPFDAEFDSGGNLNFGTGLINELGLTTGGAVKSTGGGEGFVTVEDGVLNTLSIGGVVIDHARFTSSSWSGASSLLIGSEVLLRFVVRIDFDAMMMTFTRPEAFEYRGAGAIVPFHFQDNEPEVIGAVDGIAGVFTIDTGADGSLLLIAPFARRYDLVDRYHAVIPYGGRSVTATHGVYARVGEVTLNGADGRPIVRVSRPITRISQQDGGYDADRYVSGNIEMGILKQFNITFDYSRQRIIFEPNRSFGQPDVFDRSGMQLKGNGALWTVQAVYSGGAAEIAGIHQGDVILAIDGKSRFDPTRAPVVTIMTGPIGTAVNLTIQSGNTSREVLLVLRDVL